MKTGAPSRRERPNRTLPFRPDLTPITLARYQQFAGQFIQLACRDGRGTGG